MISIFRSALVCFVILTLITGVAYPLLVTGIARFAFPHQAAGSIIVRNGTPVGSELIAQPFTDARYFWPRPSAANYNGAGGAGSNLSPTNPALRDAIMQRTDVMRAAHPEQSDPVPIDQVTASASGLDPHISLAGAMYQLSRVARARGVAVDQVRTVVDRCIEQRTFGVFGEARVNVLKLNLMLDQSHPHPDTMRTAHP